MRGIAGAPCRDFGVHGVDRARRRGRGFGDDLELLAEHDLELRQELGLHGFHVVRQIDAGGRREGLDDDDRLSLR